MRSLTSSIGPRPHAEQQAFPVAIVEQWTGRGRPWHPAARSLARSAGGQHHVSLVSLPLPTRLQLRRLRMSQTDTRARRRGVLRGRIARDFDTARQARLLAIM
jgi:hypothetical protein